VHAIINPQFFARAVLFASHSVIFTARSELRKVLFLALSMTFLFVLFVCESNISRTAERICAKFTGKTCFIPRLRSNSTYSICCGFVVDLLWICCGLVVQHFDLLWICCGFVVDLLWICCGFVVDLLWTCCGLVVQHFDLLWICCGFVVDLLWICCGFVVDLLYSLLYNKSTINRISGV